MLREELEDAAQIVQNILTQPIAASDDKMTTLLEAAQSFRKEEAMASDLRKILMNFLRYPEPTETMLREFQWLEESLTS